MRTAWLRSSASSSAADCAVSAAGRTSSSSGEVETSPWLVARVGSVAATVVAAAIRDGIRVAAAEEGA